MEKFIILLGVLLGALSVPALPALAQETEAPSEIGFEFNYNYDGKTRVTAFNVGYKRLLVDAAPVVFDATVIGASGAIESDVLSFFDEKGAVLGTLTSTFDKSGHLKSQALAEGKAPARALNWFEIGTQSPLLTLGDSVLTARYSAQDGRLKTRVLSLRLPVGTRQITTTYDALGRREHDTGTSKTGQSEVSYAYDKVGLTNLRVELPPEPGKPEPGKTEAKQSIMEMEFARAGDGQVERVTLKRDGVLAIRMVTSFDQQGESTANKAEYFEGGVLLARRQREHDRSYDGDRGV